MKKYLSIILSALAALMPGWISAKNNSTDPYKDYDETRFMDMSLDENILTPAVGKNEHAAIKTYMTRLAQDLAKKNYIVDMTRNDEVLWSQSFLMIFFSRTTLFYLRQHPRSSLQY